MPTLPLLTHISLDKIVAWQKGAPISVEKFLADAAHLAVLLPSGKHILNICRDRYHFAVGLAAAIISNKVSLLPPTHTPEMVQQLQAFSAEVFCLHDNDDCTIALPKLRYPAMPEHAASNMAIPQIDAQQLVAIVFTSGSTGTPIPHAKKWGSLVRNVQAQAARLGLSENIGLSENKSYSIVGTVPPQHMYGFESTILLPLQSGNALSSTQPFYPADICSALQETPAPRILVSTPLHLRLLLDAELEVPELVLALSATAPLSNSLAHKAEASLKAPLLEIYGSTETGQIATRRTTQGEAWQLFPDVRLTQMIEHICAVGGHLESPVPLSDIIESTSAEHFLLHGRTQDLINIAGKRSSLANLNHHLNAIDGVIDGAFFMPDEASHDHVTRLSACVVAPSLTASNLLAALRTRIDPVFLPRPLLFVEALPRNSTGKLPREALKKLIANHVNPQHKTTEQSTTQPAQKMQNKRL
ncbi:2-succinylbenzoate--CoA ligase [mine drainage metagenome]|uniref:2-succinylbenzoate--CoA ligase n=1 Tax=mine drainage metagenome TaxID=410659 RepID=A0A1J5TC29_9ZZZZ